MAKPILKCVASCIFYETSVKAAESISLRNNSVSKRIVDIAEDIENELISELYACDASVLQMYGSTDVA